MSGKDANRPTHHFTDTMSTGKFRILSKREREVLRMVIDGMSKREIAEELGLKVDTVYSHEKNLIGKLQKRNVMEVVVMFVREEERALHGHQPDLWDI